MMTVIPAVVGATIGGLGAAGAAGGSTAVTYIYSMILSILHLKAAAFYVSPTYIINYITGICLPSMIAAGIDTASFVAACELLGGQSTSDFVNLLPKHPPCPHYLSFGVFLGLISGDPVPDVHMSMKSISSSHPYFTCRGSSVSPVTLSCLPREAVVLLPLFICGGLPCVWAFFTHVFQLNFKQSDLGAPD